MTDPSVYGGPEGSLRGVTSATTSKLYLAHRHSFTSVDVGWYASYHESRSWVIGFLDLYRRSRDDLCVTSHIGVALSAITSFTQDSCTCPNQYQQWITKFGASEPRKTKNIVSSHLDLTESYRIFLRLDEPARLPVPAGDQPAPSSLHRLPGPREMHQGEHPSHSTAFLFYCAGEDFPSPLLLTGMLRS
jgi:hypothetical protein